MVHRASKCTGFHRAVCSIILLVLIAVAGGVIIWQYLPQQHKDAVATLAGGGLPLSVGSGSAPPPTFVFNQCQNQSNCCNGIEGLCAFGPDDILFAGIHNAYASAEDGFYVAPNHEYDCVAALDYGYRVINFDVGVCDGKLSFVHTLCKLGTYDPTVTLTRMQQWLNDNPNEVILIPIQLENILETPVDLGKFYNLLSQIDGFTNRMYQKISGQDWPSLRELIDTDKRIIMFHYNGDSCSAPGIVCPPGFHDWFAFAGESKYAFTAANEFDDKASACNVTRGQKRGPFYGVNLFVEIPSKQLASTLLNTKAFLQDHIAACSAVNGGLDVNVVFVDFWNQGNLPEVTQIHNTILANQRRMRSLRSS